MCWIVQPLEQLPFSKCSITAEMDAKIVVLEQLARQCKGPTSGLGLTLALNASSGFGLTSDLGLELGLWTSSLCF